MTRIKLWHTKYQQHPMLHQNYLLLGSGAASLPLVVPSYTPPGEEKWKRQHSATYLESRMYNEPNLQDCNLSDMVCDIHILKYSFYMHLSNRSPYVGK